MFLDIGLGIITAILFSFYFHFELSFLLVPAIIFSLLPDLDFVLYKVFDIHPEKGYKHRDLFHYPLLYSLVGFVAIYIFFNRWYPWLFLVISFLHFVHDSIAYGRGIKWLWPFSKDGYAFFYFYSRVNKKGLWQPVFIFNEEAIKKFDEKHGDEDWIKNIYLKFHPIAAIETLVFIISLLWLYFYTR